MAVDLDTQGYFDYVLQVSAWNMTLCAVVDLNSDWLASISLSDLIFEKPARVDRAGGLIGGDFAARRLLMTGLLKASLNSRWLN